MYLAQLRLRVCLVVVCAAGANAFVAPARCASYTCATRLASSALRSPPHMQAAAAALPPPPIQPPRFVKVKGEILTPYGVLLGAMVFATAMMVQIPVYLAYAWSTLFDAKRRRAVDWIIYFWARFSMTVCGYSPEVVGLENLPPHGETCLYVPNHTSFMDILTLTGFIPRPMKYVSKKEILAIPFIGWPMRLAGHIAIKTASRRSQLETFKDTVASLVDGNSVITFPEGTRSGTGKLLPFKRGPFKMAIKSNVKIVPVSICGLARWYPKGTLLPLDVPKDVKVVIHPPIDVASSDLSEGEICDQCYETINGALPAWQQGPKVEAA